MKWMKWKDAWCGDGKVEDEVWDVNENEWLVVARCKDEENVKVCIQHVVSHVIYPFAFSSIPRNNPDQFT